MCHENAECINIDGSFMCECNPGFIGDGVNNCTGKMDVGKFPDYLNILSL